MVSKSNEQGMQNVCTVFKLLSDKTRLQIVLHLAEGERTVTSLCKDLKLPQPTVSHHLGLLRMNRLIVNKRHGKQVIYSLGNSAKSGRKALKFSLPPYALTLEEA
ncbi:MAG TPA: metalloregulator ArsR/SmtB family transcription factor [Phycisphaerae bacterium]|nr:metalloregulator ArsR/SmtB family transcription factor [Phycisphaerae bacterium]